MSASAHIGRIGALAAALGVGAALLTGPAVAGADPTGSDGSSTPDSGASAGRGAGPSRGHARSANTESTGTASHSAIGADPAADGAVPDDAADPAPRRASTRATTASEREAAVITAPVTESQSGPTPQAGEPAAAPVTTNSVGTVPNADPLPSPAPAASVAVPAPAATLSAPPLGSSTAETVVAPAQSVSSTAVAPAPGLPGVLAEVAGQITAAVTSVVSALVNTFSGNAPFAPQADSPLNWLMLAAVRRDPLAAATGAAQTAVPVGPTLFVLNGYKVVAASTELVTSFYGPFVNFPGSPGVQSQQTFNLVDPKTNAVVGSFAALSSRFTGIGTTRELLVTDVLSGTAGTAAGEVPPVGSVIIATGDNGIWSVYSSMPSGSGTVVSYKWHTPIGEVPLPALYDAAKGLTDFATVNAPIALAGGFSIAPKVPSTEKFTAVTGMPPLFNAIQGVQTYALFDKSGNPVGHFEGLVTATSDFLGLYTKAILVTSTGDSTDVGTRVGQVPPVGTVYNFINFTNSLYVVYTSMPTETGTTVSTKLVTPLGTIVIPLSFDASTPPPMTSLQVPLGVKFVPKSDLKPAGVNGLPPREVIIQGYQQFDVLDGFGNKLGSVDADVMRQWDWFGGQSDAIMITKVTAGTEGLLPWNVPPVGSVYNFRHPFGISIGFSDFYSSIPTILGDAPTYQTLTPWGIIPLYLPNYLSAGLANAKFVNPFAV